MVTTKERFTVQEAAEYLCVSRRTIYKLTGEGRLPAFRVVANATTVSARRTSTVHCGPKKKPPFDMAFSD